MFRVHLKALLNPSHLFHTACVNHSYSFGPVPQEEEEERKQEVEDTDVE